MKYCNTSGPEDEFYRQEFTILIEKFATVQSVVVLAIKPEYLMLMENLRNHDGDGNGNVTEKKNILWITTT